MEELSADEENTQSTDCFDEDDEWVTDLDDDNDDLDGFDLGNYAGALR
ncbi:MAG TPA: hypothetical protein VJ576_03785 [Rhodocyclaceae bacterium]|nr:hypothetical protein [Rhodocyclaceae bacterium]